MAGMLIHYKKSCCNFSENQIEQYCCAAHTASIVVKNIVQHLYAQSSGSIILFGVVITTLNHVGNDVGSKTWKQCQFNHVKACSRTIQFCVADHDGNQSTRPTYQLGPTNLAQFLSSFFSQHFVARVRISVRAWMRQNCHILILGRVGLHSSWLGSDCRMVWLA
jgi:hypothetical protein